MGLKVFSLPRKLTEETDMNQDPILNIYCRNLADLVNERSFEPPHLNPLSISPWLAMSLLQKAIRRGDIDYTLGSAATLLETAPDRLWRRLCVTAFEDIGVGDIETISLVMAGLTGKAWRARNGGDWRIASYLVQRMAGSVKCRATDDLTFIAERHPDFELDRLRLTFEPIPKLLDMVVSNAPLPRRALSLWYAIGTHRCRSDILRTRKGDPHGVLDALCERGFPESLIEISRSGLAKCGEIIVPFVPLLWRELQRSTSTIEKTSLPRPEMIGGIPAYAYNMHTREGKQAFGLFLKSDSETVRWLASIVPPAKRSFLLGHMIFRIESASVDRRLRWGTGDRLWQMSDVEAHGYKRQEMAEGLRLLHKDLPLLNEARRHIAGVV